MKFSTKAVLVIVTANAMIGAAGTAGMWDAWGIEVTAGVSQQQLDKTSGAFDNVTSGNLGASTLLSSFVFTARSMATAWGLVTALPTFLENMGVPAFIATIPNVLVVILVGRDVLQVMVGRVI